MLYNSLILLKPKTDLYTFNLASLVWARYKQKLLNFLNSSQTADLADQCIDFDINV